MNKKEVIIAILMGGDSAERKVSLRSGENVYQALKTAGVNCFVFDVKKDNNGDNLAQLWQKKFTHIFILLHGKGGEDGVIQAQLEQRGLAFSGSNSWVSKICIDKEKTKNLWQKHQLPIAKFILSTPDNPMLQPDFALPWIVKPTIEGSSFGISKISQLDQLQDALTLAREYDKRVMIEQYITGKEYTIGVVQNKTSNTIQALPIIEIEHQLDFLDYQSKYFDNTHKTHHHCPAQLDTITTQKLQQLAISAFEVLGCKDWARIDLMVEDNQPFLLEINNAPGMTPASLIPIAIKAADIDMADFVLQVLGIG